MVFPSADSPQPEAALWRIHGDQSTGGHIRDDFAVNVMAETPQYLRHMLRAGLAQLSSYPDAHHAAAVAARIAAAHGINAADVLLLAGGAEGFALLPTLLSPAGEVVMVHPSFTEPDAVFAAHGIAAQRYLLPAPFTLTPEHLTALADYPAELVIIGNPTNPTGVLHQPEQLLRLCRPGRVLVVDEAFMDLCGESASLITAATTSHRGQLLVLRSLTKSAGLAGLRCGLAIGATELLAQLARNRPHWPVSTPALLAMDAVYSPLGQAHLNALRHTIATRRAALAQAVGDCGLTVVAPSQAAFLLVRHGFSDDVAVRAALAERGIAVRRCDTFPGLGEEYWRLAVRGPAAVARLSSAVTQLRAAYA